MSSMGPAATTAGTNVPTATRTAIQPIMQKRIWDRFKGSKGREALDELIEKLRKEDGRFHMEGGSWTNNLSWVRGYGNVLGPMEQASALFAEKTRGVDPSEPAGENLRVACEEIDLREEELCQKQRPPARVAPARESKHHQS